MPLAILAKRTPNLPLLLTFIVAAVAGLSAVAFFAWGPGQEKSFREDQYSSAMWRPAPASIQELVDEADAIATGTISEFIDERLEGPYFSEETGDARLPAKFHYSYYRISLDRVLKDDGYIRDIPVLKLKGRESVESEHILRINLPPVGTTFYFFLARNPDNLSYGVGGPWKLINTDHKTVVQYGYNLPEPSFARGMTPEEFGEEVLRALGQ